MDVLRSVLVVSTWVIALALFWHFAHDSMSAWWFWLLAITSTLLVSLYWAEDLLPLSHISFRTYRTVKGVLFMILWVLFVIMVLSVAGILPAIFH